MEKENLFKNGIAAKQPKTILDIATGTGDLAILFANTSAIRNYWFGYFAKAYDIGKKKIAAQNLDSGIQMVLGDGENIPYPDNYFDAITVAYGVCNWENLEKVKRYFKNIKKPGGQLIILETSLYLRFLLNKDIMFIPISSSATNYW